jgi:hypothetical protein
MTLINPESVYLRFTLSASPLGVNSVSLFFELP